MLSNRHVEPSNGPRSSLRLAAFEVVWIFLVFFLFAGSPPPDAGESHYLVKAKHYWNPTWCAGDLFLQSYDTHVGFYWALGWLTRLCSLDATAWIARVIAWGGLAWAWRRLSWALLPQPLVSLLSAGLMLLFAEHFHWSKEILLRGGVEGKTIAYIGVLLALEAIIKDHWRAALVWAGAAGAFHVLVGGWTVVALGLAWIFTGSRRPSISALLPAAAIGLVLALPGLIPSILLLLRAQPDRAAEACRIYVFDRLAHHLVFHRFEVWYQVRHLALAAVWIWLAWMQWRDAGVRRLSYVVAGAAVIALAGIAIDQGFVLRANLLGQPAEAYELAAGPWLRYYWFRVEDALSAVAAGLLGVRCIYSLQRGQPGLAQGLLIAAILASTANVVNACYWRARLRVPGAVIQQQPTADTQLNWCWERAPSDRRPADHKAEPDLRAISAREHYASWQDACRWIAEHTPSDRKFLTPRRQQTFKWNAGRAEVATRKDLPQDPASILAWHAAIMELYPNDAPHRQFDLAAFSDAELVKLAHKYGCQYIVAERRWGARRIRLPRVYPVFAEENPLYEVFRIPAEPTQ
jgi:hypothetical protein